MLSQDFETQFRDGTQVVHGQPICTILFFKAIRNRILMRCIISSLLRIFWLWQRESRFGFWWQNCWPVRWRFVPESAQTRVELVTAGETRSQPVIEGREGPRVVHDQLTGREKGQWKYCSALKGRSKKKTEPDGWQTECFQTRFSWIVGMTWCDVTGGCAFVLSEVSSSFSVITQTHDVQTYQKQRRGLLILRWDEMFPAWRTILFYDSFFSPHLFVDNAEHNVNSDDHRGPSYSQLGGIYEKTQIILAGRLLEGFSWSRTTKLQQDLHEPRYPQKGKFAFWK